MAALLDTKTFKKTLTEQFDKHARLINSAFQEQKDYMNGKFNAIDVRLDDLEKRLAKIEDELKALSAKLTAHLELSDKRYLELKRRDLIIAKWLKAIADKTGVPIDLAELERF